MCLPHLQSHRFSHGSSTRCLNPDHRPSDKTMGIEVYTPDKTMGIEVYTPDKVTDIESTLYTTHCLQLAGSKPEPWETTHCQAQSPCVSGRILPQARVRGRY
jgi:hypothetical protein